MKHNPRTSRRRLCEYVFRDSIPYLINDSIFFKSFNRRLQLRNFFQFSTLHRCLIMPLTQLCSSLFYLTPGQQSITSEICFMSTESYNIFLDIRDMIEGVTSVLLGRRHEPLQQVDPQMSFCSSGPLRRRIISQVPYQCWIRNAACLGSLLNLAWNHHDDPKIIDQNERTNHQHYPRVPFR